MATLFISNWLQAVRLNRNRHPGKMPFLLGCIVTFLTVYGSLLFCAGHLSPARPYRASRRHCHHFRRSLATPMQGLRLVTVFPGLQQKSRPLIPYFWHRIATGCSLRRAMLPGRRNHWPGHRRCQLGLGPIVHFFTSMWPDGW